MIKLGLSGRVIERGASEYLMDTPEFVRFAHETGYEAVELRCALGEIRSDKAAALIPAAIRRIKRRGAHIVNLMVDAHEFWLGDGSE